MTTTYRDITQTEAPGELNRSTSSPASASRQTSTPGRTTRRVAIVAASLEILGGQGVQAALLIQALKDDGHQVTLMPVNMQFPAGLRWLRKFRGVRTIVNQLLYLPSLLRLSRVDVAHVFSASYWSFLLAPLPAMLVGRFFGKRVILHYHSGEAEDHLAHWGWLVHPWLALADEIVVPSDYLRDTFSRYGHRARVIANIVDVSHFKYRERTPATVRLLSTRNLEPYYAVDQTIHAFSMVKMRYPEATLTIVGYGSEEGRLRELAGSLGAGGIRFVGRIEQDRMPWICDEAAIFLNSSILDNQPVSILEAFAAGLPVISTPTGGIAEMVQHGTNGMVVAARNPAAMAAAVSVMVDDPDWTLRLARQAKRDVSKYSWPAVREAWAECYQ